MRRLGIIVAWVAVDAVFLAVLWWLVARVFPAWFDVIALAWLCWCLHRIREGNSIMPFKQVQPSYEAEQFTGDNFGAFVAVVDPDNQHDMVDNGDGTCSYSLGLGGFTIGTGDWLISQAYYGTFPGWNQLGGASGTMPDAEFQLQYVSV